jgi:sugar lactone lactonase YvrE
VSIDKNNDVWVSGSTIKSFDKIKGGKFDTLLSGTIIRSEPAAAGGYGGYGGLMDTNGVIWSARPLLRWDTALSLTGGNGDPDTSGPNIGPPKAGFNWTGQGNFDSYGLCIDRDGNVWNTAWSNLIHKYKSNGEYINKYDHGFNGAQGCVVDQKGDVWVAHSLSGSTVGHLNNAGTRIGIVTVGSGPTGVAVDALGKVWSANYNGNSLSRIDPGLGAAGEVDKTVELGSGCTPYNYGDMTGSTNIAPPKSGSWIVVHDSGVAKTDWGRIEWTAKLLSDSKLTVYVSGDGLEWGDPVTNGQELLSQTGQTLHVRVLFERASTGESPVLYDLSLINNEPPDCSKAVASPSEIWPPNHKFRSVLVNGVTDPDDDKVTIKVTSIFQDEPVNTQGDGNTCADGKITATGGAEVRAERTGTKQVPGDGRVYHIEFTADDGKGGKCDGEVIVCVPHDQGNKPQCVDGGKLNDSTKCP